MRCPTCQTRNRAGANYCKECRQRFSPNARTRSLNLETADIRYASYAKRFSAFLIDFCFLMAIFFISLLVAFAIWQNDADLASSRTIWLTLIGALLYWVGPMAHDGQTWGKKIVNIRVINLSGKPPNWSDAFMRQVVGFFLGIIMFRFITDMYRLTHTHNQLWHDRFANTIVIDAKI